MKKTIFLFCVLVSSTVSINAQSTTITKATNYWHSMQSNLSLSKININPAFTATKNNNLYRKYEDANKLFKQFRFISQSFKDDFSKEQLFNLIYELPIPKKNIGLGFIVDYQKGQAILTDTLNNTIRNFSEKASRINPSITINYSITPELYIGGGIGVTFQNIERAFPTPQQLLAKQTYKNILPTIDIGVSYVGKNLSVGLGVKQINNPTFAIKDSTVSEKVAAINPNQGINASFNYSFYKDKWSVNTFGNFNYLVAPISKINSTFATTNKMALYASLTASYGKHVYFGSTLQAGRVNDLAILAGLRFFRGLIKFNFSYKFNFDPANTGFKNAETLFNLNH